MKRLFHDPHRRLLGSVVFLALAIALLYTVRGLGRHDTGLVVNYPEVTVTDGKVVFSPRTPFSPAREAGLRPGDVLLTIEGAPVRGSWDVVQADLRATSRPVVVGAQREGQGEVTANIQPQRAFSEPEWLFQLLLSVILALTALAVARHVPRPSAAIFLSLAAASYLVFTAAKPYYYADFISNLLIHSGKATSSLLVLYALHAPVKWGTRRLRRVLTVAFLVGLVAFVGWRMRLFLGWSATGLEVWLQRYRGLGRFANAFDAVAYVSFALLLAGGYRRSEGAARRLVEWTLLGAALSLPPYFFLDQLPIILGTSGPPRIGLGAYANLFLAPLPICVLIGIFRTARLEARAVLIRSSAWIITVLVELGFFRALYTPITEQFTDWPRDLHAFVVTALLLVLVVPFHSVVVVVAERWLQRSPTGRRAEAEPGRRDTTVESLRELAAGLLHGPVSPASEASGTGPGPGRDTAVLRRFLAETELDGAHADIEASHLIRRAAAELGRRHPRVEVVVAGAEARVVCFPRECIRAVGEVLLNAAEAYGAVGGAVAVTVGRDGRHCQMTVRDQAGAPTASVQQLATPFYTTKVGHDGLGLYLAGLLAARSGGALIFLHRMDGFEATITLPLAEAYHPEKEQYST